MASMSLVSTSGGLAVSRSCSTRAVPAASRRARLVTRLQATGSTPPPPTPDFSSSPSAIPPPPTDGFGAASTEPLGAKLDKWMKDPLSLMAMGPRAGLGALTTAGQVLDRLPEMQAEFEEKMNFVMNDPRTVDEKQELIAKDVEATLAELITKGEELETDVLSQVTANLPPDVLSAIPAELKEAFPGLNTAAGPTADPFADEWETKYDDSYTYTPPPYSPNPPSSTGSPTAASDMMMLRDAAKSVRSALQDIQTNTDPSKSAMLKVSLKDSRDELARRVRESGSIQYDDPSTSAALIEAKKLLEEVDSLRL